jgi:hypothetical protein
MGEVDSPSAKKPGFNRFKNGMPWGIIVQRRLVGVEKL